MLSDVQKLSAEPNELKDQVVELRSECQTLKDELKSRDLLIEKLKHQLSGLNRFRFGSRSESLDQMTLLLENEEIAAAAEAYVAAPEKPAEIKNRTGRKPLPEPLPREDLILSPGEACQDCGGRLKALGEEVTEELEYIPGRFRVNRIIRPKRSCKCCETIHQPPLSARPIERGRPGPGLLAHILVSKYADHLPLYRQSQIYAREGLNLDRSTLADWIGKSTALLEPLAESIGRFVKAGTAIFADDTTAGVLSPGKGKTKTGRIWA